MSKKEKFEVLGKARVIQGKTGVAEVEISQNLLEDQPMHITFIAMQVETFAHRLNMPVEKALEMIKQNIEVEPMEFD